jgi:hypothetical protein
MFDLASILFFIIILVVGVLGFNQSIKCANVDAELEDASINTHEDILMFSEFKRVAVDREKAENSDCIASKVIAMKRCDNTIIHLAKQIKKRDA